MKNIIKKIFLFLIVSMLLINQSFALDVYSRRVSNSSGTAFSSLAIASGATVYSESISQQNNVGFSSILAVEDKSGGAGNVAISAEYSNDGTNFYTPYTTNAGTLTADSAIVTSLANASRWIVFTPRLGKYFRFKIVATTDSQLTLDLFYQRGQ